MEVPVTEQFNAFLSQLQKVVVCDVGSNPEEGGVAPYKVLLDGGRASVVGFEPHPETFEMLQKMKGADDIYLPYALGDGHTHPFYICEASGMSSLLEPDPQRLAMLNKFSLFGSVKQRIDIETKRMDDLIDLPDFDMLKIDIQGGELMVLAHGLEKLKSASLVHIEVNFFRLYKNQPSFGEIDQFMRAQGFVFHKFPELKPWSFAPVVKNGDPRIGFSQIIDGDAVYMRDLTYIDTISNRQLGAMFQTLVFIYGAIDAGYLIAAELFKRGVGQHDPNQWYLQCLG